jgi:hypothetical protein
MLSLFSLLRRMIILHAGRRALLTRDRAYNSARNAAGFELGRPATAASSFDLPAKLPDFLVGPLLMLRAIACLLSDRVRSAKRSVRVRTVNERTHKPQPTLLVRPAVAQS